MSEPSSVAPVCLDDDRLRRIGLAEAILCGQKSIDHVVTILRQAKDQRRSLLLTRLPPEQFAALPDLMRGELDYDPLSHTAFLGPIKAPAGPPRIVVISAGTSDVPVCREAVRTLQFYGVPCREIYDVGVAGLWRLLARQDELVRMDVVITVAGMDAALPSVVGGLVPALVIAVPTSVGYGAARAGETALMSALTSCAQGVVVVNIDNGFGAACAALRTIRPREGAMT